MALRCLPLSCVCGDFFFPQRKLLVIMLFLAICYSYIMRILFHMSILYLKASPKADGQYRGNPDDCCDCLPAFIPYQTWKPVAETYSWIVIGIIMSSFFIGYFIAQCICLECYRIKPKLPILFAVAFQAIFFILIPISFTLHWVVVCIFRALQGFSAGFVYYFASRMTSDWIPTNDRGIVNIFLFSASHLGSMIGPFGVVAINNGTKTWTSVFYIFGVLSLVWCIFFGLLCYNTFRVHPYILKKEYDYLAPQIQATNKFKRSKVSCKKVLQSKGVRALIFATVGHDFLFYLYLNWIFWFFYQRKYSMMDIGLTVSYSFVALYLGSILFAVIRSTLDKVKCISKLCQRKIFTSIGMLLPAICLVALTFCDCRTLAALLIALLALLFMGAYYSGVPLNIYDLAPIHAEKVAIVLNIFGTLQGIISAVLQGIFLELFGAELKGFLYMFLVNLGIVILCWILYVTTATITRVKWDYVVTDRRNMQRGQFMRRR